MSDFLAEARVLIRPDTTKFRALLVAEVAAASKGIAVPITVAPVATGGSLAALGAQAGIAAHALDDVAAAQKAGAEKTKQASKATADHTRRMNQATKGALATAASFTGLRGAVLAASGPFLAAAIAATAFAKAVQSATALETELNVFRVTAGATAEEMERVQQTAVALGRDLTLPSVSAGDAAESFTRLAKAGLSVENSLAGARGVLQLATAAQIDNATASELVANALNTFNLEGAEAVRIADLLTGAANQAQGSIEDMGLALRQSAAVASLVGISVEDTVVILTQLARAGLSSSDAGTSFRTALVRLINPTKNVQEALNKLGVDLRDVEGNIRPEIFSEIGEALESMPPAARQTTVAILGGSDAIRAFGLLSRETAASTQALKDAVTEQGLAAELSGARTAGFAGKMEALKSNLETLGSTLGQFVIGPLGDTVAGLADVASGFANAAEKAREFEDSLPGRDEGPFGFLSNLPEQAREVQAFFDLIGQGKTLEFGELPTDALKRVRTEADLMSAALARAEIESGKLQASFIEGGGIGSPTAVNEFVLKLDDLADRLEKGDEKAKTMAVSIRAVIRELQTPTSFIVDLDLDFDGREVDKKTGEVKDSVRQSLVNAGGAIKEVGTMWMDLLAEGITEGTPKVEAAASAAGVTAQQALATELAVAGAEGDEAATLSLLRERERRQEAFLARILARPQTQKTAALAEQAAKNLEETRDEIDAIVTGQAAKAAADAADAAAKLDKADQDFIDGLNLEEQKKRNAVLAAQATARLDDDVTAQTALRNFYKRAVAEVRKTVNDAKLAAQIIADLTADFINANDAMADAKQAQIDAMKKERAAERDRQRESLSLDVQIAEASGNKNREISAREAEIEGLKKLRAMYRRGTNQYKQLTLEILQRKKALAELKGEQDEEGRTAQQVLFGALQQQAGFVANLLGNLIPTNATAGLVGGSTVDTSSSIPDVGAGIRGEAAAKTGQSQFGPSSGQMNTEIDILRRILLELQQANQGSSHPEAKYERATGSSVMDVQ